MKNLLLCIALALIIGCEKNPERIGPCGTTKPLEDLEWLKKKVELFSKPPDFGYAIFTTIYQKKEYFGFMFHTQVHP